MDLRVEVHLDRRCTTTTYFLVRGILRLMSRGPGHCLWTMRVGAGKIYSIRRRNERART